LGDENTLPDGGNDRGDVTGGNREGRLRAGAGFALKAAQFKAAGFALEKLPVEAFNRLA
jgi:hypothetical protein